MDKGGHKPQILEASRNFSFSHFTQGTAFVPLWQTGLDDNRFKSKDYR